MSTELKVGFFIVISLGVLAYFMVNTGEWDLFGNKTNTYELRCRFNNVVGLTKGAGVSLSGVRIGEVVDIRLDGHKALVIMEILESIPDFPASSEARISSVGLLGQAAVEVIPDELNKSGLTAREQGEIGSRDPVTVDQLVAVLQSIGDDATELVGSVRDFLYGNEARVVDILENLREFTDELEKVVAQNSTALKESLDSIKGLSADMKKNLPAILEDVKSLSTGLKEIMESQKGNVGASVERTKLLIEKLDKSAVTLQEILDKINKGDGAVGKLLNEPETIDKANEVLDRANNVISDFQDFIKSPTGISFDYGFRAEYYQQSEDFKYYYRLSTHFSPSDSLLIELINDQIHNKPPIFDPDSGDDLNQALDILGDDFTFSATYGRDFPGGTIRLGLIESVTGLAVDMGGTEDVLNFTFEGYDFGRDKGPHLKFSAHLRVWSGMHLTFGYDDPIDEDKSQWFYGAGYRF